MEDHEQTLPLRDNGEANPSNTTRLYSWVRMAFVLLLASVVWFYVAYRFWEIEPAKTVRFLGGALCFVLIAYVVRRCILRGRTSLRALVFGGPIAIAVLTIPLRSVVYHQQLIGDLTAARIDEYSLGRSSQIMQVFGSLSATLLGTSTSELFSNELYTLRAELTQVDIERMHSLPTQHLSLLSFHREPLPATSSDGNVTAATVDWLNGCPEGTVVNMDLKTVFPTELQNFSKLKRSINLRLRGLPDDEMEFVIPSAFQLSLSETSFTKGLKWSRLDLAALERLSLSVCELGLTPAFKSLVECSGRLSVRDTDIDAETLNYLLAREIRGLSFREVRFPAEFTQPLSVHGKYLTLWDCQLDPELALGMIEARQTEHVQLSLEAALSLQQFERLVTLPNVSFIRMTSPWLTMDYLEVLTQLDKSIRIVAFESQLTPDQIEWIGQHKSDQVELRLQGISTFREQ